jgi:lipopolysaccharide export system protein LptC
VSDTGTSLSPSPQGGGSPKVAQPWNWRLRQFAASFMPLMLMAFLAVGTWWLVKNSQQGIDSRAAGPARHEPDYEMTNFSVQRYNADGSMRAHLAGDLLRHYPDTDTLEIDSVRLRAVATEDGRVSTATARRAVAKGDATEVELFGGAEVVREALGTDEATRFRSEYLHAFIDDERVLSNQPVVVTKGGTQVRADGMDYTQSDGVIKFNGRSRATFGPRSKP